MAHPRPQTARPNGAPSSPGRVGAPGGAAVELREWVVNKKLLSYYCRLKAIAICLEAIITSNKGHYYLKNLFFSYFLTRRGFFLDFLVWAWATF